MNMLSRETLFAKQMICWVEAEKTLRKSSLIKPNFWSSELSALASLHAEIALEMENYINSWGWPGSSTVGQDGAVSAAYLVRHCVTQPKFMRYCLPFLEQAFRFGDAWGVFFAELYDTIMYFEGKPQVYGTFLDWDLQGELAPWKIIEVSRVNHRRSAILLEPMSKYLQRMRLQAKNEAWPVPADIPHYRSSVVAFAKKYHWNRSSELARGV